MTDTPVGAAPATAADRPVDVPALTGLRAFAALAVLLFHLRPLGFRIAPETAVAKPFLDAGSLGVDVFFVLSGFVIAHTYAHRLAAPAPRAVRDYLVARLARIYPLHLVTFLLMCVLIVVGLAQGIDVDAAVDAQMDHTVLGFVGNLLMLQTLPGIPPWNGPAWSISCELAAYLVFPLVAARLFRLRWATAAALALAVLGLQLLVMYQFRTLDYTVLVWPRIAGGFGAGALMWVVWSRRLRPGVWADAVAVLCVLASAWVLWGGHEMRLIIPLLSLMVPAVAAATGPVARLLAHPVTQWGGRISFALYLVHIPVFTVILIWVVPTDVYFRPTPLSASLVLGGLVLASVVAAALLHHGVEEPARRWVRRRFTARTVTPASEPAGEAARSSG